MEELAKPLSQTDFQKDSQCPPTTPIEVTILKRRLTPGDRLRMPVSYEGRGEEGVILNAEKGIIFRVRRDTKILNNKKEEVGFNDLILPVIKEVEAGNLDEAIRLACQARDQFTQILEKNPSEKNRILFALKRLINMRLTDSHTPNDQKPALQSLLSANLEDPQRFQEALNLVFNFDELKQDAQSPDEKTKIRTGDRLRIKIFELAALVFGTEGLQRTVEIDLRMAVGLENVLLTPEARRQRIELLKKANELRRQMIEIKNSTGESPEERQLKSLIAESKWQEALTQLRQLEQQQREAILYAFGVKDDDGNLLVDESRLTDEQKQLARLIKERLRTLISNGQDKVLSLNRTMVVEMLQMLQPEGVSLSPEQIRALNELISGTSQKTVEETLTEWGMNPEDEKYQLIKAIIEDGRRVVRSLTGLARKVQDDFSRVEDLSLTGYVGDKRPRIDGSTHHVLLMGLKGVEYMYRHFQFEIEEKKVTVLIKEKKPATKPPSPVPTHQEPPPVAGEAESPEQRLDRLTNFAPEIIEADQRRADKLRQENKPPKEQQRKRVSLERLKEQLEAAIRELETFDPTSIQELAREIYARGIGQIRLREVDDQTRKLGKTRVIFTLPDGQKVDLASERGPLTQIEFDIESPSGQKSKIKLSPEAILNSPELAKELMEEVYYQQQLEQQVKYLRKAVEVKEQLESAKRTERNLAALEEKFRLRELVTGLKEEQRQIAERDLETIRPLIDEYPEVLQAAQSVLTALHRRGIFRRDIARFHRLAEKLAYQLEQNSGWSPKAHQSNIEAVKRALLYQAIMTFPY